MFFDMAVLLRVHLQFLGCLQHLTVLWCISGSESNEARPKQDGEIESPFYSGAITDKNH